MKLLQGVVRFQRDVFPRIQPIFEAVRERQRPHTMMIACSDSRIDPCLFTQALPGEMFVLRNAGNIVTAGGGEEASIEYAIDHLEVEDIVICGHTGCGALTATSGDVRLADTTLALWLRFTGHSIHDPSSDARLEAHVLRQLEHLESLRVVSRALAAGRVQTHAWIYVVHRGEIRQYDREAGSFVAIGHSSAKDAVSRGTHA